MIRDFIMKNKKLLIIAGFLFVVFKMFSSCGKSSQPLEIMRSTQVKKGNIKVQVESTASVKPYNRVELKPPIPGRVEQVLVEEGDTVKQGQVLAWMSSVERSALLDAASSQGEEVLKRWQEVYKPAPLIAPLNGSVIVRSAEPGQTVTSADPVIVLADRLIIQALVDETDLAQIKLKQKTEISMDAYRNQLILGKVGHISYESTLVNNVNMYAVDVLPEKVPEELRSGMTATVRFIVTDKEDILVLSSDAVTQWPRNKPKPADSSEWAVYKKAFGGKLVPVAVKTGETDGRMTEIISGLAEGDEVQVVRKKEKTTGGAFNPMGGGKPQQGGRKNFDGKGK